MLFVPYVAIVFFHTMNIRLDGRVSIVTGASRGLGRAICLALAESGATVIGVARSRTGLDETAAAVAKVGGVFTPHPADLTSSEEVNRLVDTVLERHKRIHVLVNNAGLLLERPFLDISEEEWNRAIQTNLGGCFRLTQGVGRHMVEIKSGSVIQIGSIWSEIGVNRMAAYCTSKGGIDALSKALAVEWARFNVRVNVIAPGYFDTDMTRSAMEDDRARPVILGRIPLRRIGKPEEIGPLVVYLASDAAAFVTGSTFVIDGGQNISW